MAKTLLKRHAPAPACKSNGAVAELLNQRAGMIQRMEYEPLGLMLQLQTPFGWIEFRRNHGPAIGRLADGSIDMLDPWPGLKDHLEVTPELCSDCQAPCDECGATGKRLCTKCGGAKSIKGGESACECVAREGIANLSCRTCRGSGALPVLICCPVCLGSSQIQCPECAGTAKMSTGHLHGAPPTRRGEVCPACEGYGKKLLRVPQELELHVIHQNGADYLGPVISFLLKPIGEQREPEPWNVSADGQGHFLYFISQRNFEPGSSAAFLGGIVVRQHNAN